MFFRKNVVLFSDTSFKVLRKKYNIKHLPKEGDFVYFDTDKNYFVVNKIIHNISKKNIVWVTLTLVENNENT